MEDQLHIPQVKISYLQSRDPSIISWNRLEKVRANLHFSSDESTVPSLPLPDKVKEKHVDVYLRIKGGVECSDIYAIEEEDTFVCELPETSTTISGNKNGVQTAEKYKFTKIFNSGCTQEEIFHATVKEKILNFINGENSTLMAYGTSGSGKTFTLVGTTEEPGIIPRALKYLFHSLPTLEQFPQAKPLPNGNAVILDNTQKLIEKQQSQSILKDLHAYKDHLLHEKAFSAMQQRLSRDPVAIVENLTPIINIWVSLAEIYNEQIFDLLNTPIKGQQRPRLKIGGLHNNTYIKDLKFINVRSGLEAYEVLQYGLQNRNRASTVVNMQSSRSHCIFSIKLVQGYDADNLLVSSFNFCDLAGSERLKKTMNVGDRLKESNSINNSLMVLGRCITMVRDGQYKKENKMPPFRESKLTQLFQRALIGKEDIQLMVNVNLSKDMFPETQHTLNFSAMAKEVIIDQAPVKVLNSSRFLDKDFDEEDTRDEELDELRDRLAEVVLQLSEERQQNQQRQEEAIERERQHLINTYKEIINIKDKQIETLKRENEILLKEKREREKAHLQSFFVVSSGSESDFEDELGVTESDS
ncbi:kinesin-like protein subito isoform X1 [Sitophilus oryzae]|uniref:Kinesin-like protein n=1 Tax=Sitophilus oryzae TaxID=7048 RepID=A0A6J2XNG4_SITOR|nr:kinesin-like protein subito isoform X1 [Sitophilus oryzae]